MELVRSYRNLIEDLFFNRRFERVGDYVAEDYVGYDAFTPRPPGAEGMAVFHRTLLRELCDLCFDVCDQISNGERLATRFSITGRRLSDGATVAVRGISIHEARDGRFVTGWGLNDYRDIGLHQYGPTTDDALVGWDGPVIDRAPAGSRLAIYLRLIDTLYRQRDASVLRELVHERYLAHDPFAARGAGRADSEAFYRGLLARYRSLQIDIVDAVECGDRLAVRCMARGERIDGRKILAPGMSIHHFEGDRLRRGWVMNRYGGALDELELGPGDSSS